MCSRITANQQKNSQSFMGKYPANSQSCHNPALSVPFYLFLSTVFHVAEQCDIPLRFIQV